MGTTGRPKGVSVSHSAIGTYLAEALRIYEVPESGMAFPLQLPPTFDAALTSVLPPLVTGNVAIPIRDEVSATRGLARFLRSTERPVLIKTTPSQLTLLRDFSDPGDFEDLLVTIVVGGEPLSFDHLAWIRRIPGIRIFNEYGPTEATVGCSVYRVVPNDPDTGPVPIGTPHAGAVFTVDPDAEASEDAPAGELVISGRCLANGYINQVGGGFTERAGERQYRTGDWVRRDSAGYYHFLGRRDDQIKVNGIRVELGEIETAIRAATGGRPAAVAMTGTTLVGATEGCSSLDITRIKAELRRRLPPHMRLVHLHSVPAIPLTAHGKVDRIRLRELLSNLANPQPEAYRGPDADPIVNAAERAWSTLLGPDNLGRDTDFFAVGDSITALRLVGRVAAELGHEVPVSLIFDHRTLKTFTDALRRHLHAPTSASGEKGCGDHARTPTPPQTAILDAERWAPAAGLYTVVDAVNFDGVANWSTLPTAINRTVARHDVFTWRFDRDADDCVVAAGGPDARLLVTPTEIVDLCTLPPEQAQAHIDARLAYERQQPVALVGEPHGAHPRAIVFQLQEGNTAGQSGVLALLAHHAVVDELSIDLLWREIFARAAGLPAPDAYDSRYAEWAEQTNTAAARRRAVRSADEIADHLCAGPLGVLTPRNGAIPAGPAASPLRFVVPTGLSARCTATAAIHSVPVSAVYGVAMVRALGAFTSHPRFAVFMPMTLRRREAEFDSVGCFVASVPVLAERPLFGEPAAAAITRWHRAVGSAAQRADADQPHLAERLQTAAPTWFTAARVSLAFEQNATGRIGPVTWSTRPALSATAKYDLSIYLTPGTSEHPGTGRIMWRESRGCRNRIADIAAELVDTFLSELQSLCTGVVRYAGAREQMGKPLAETTAELDKRSRQAAHDDRPAQADVAHEFARLAADLLDQQVGVTTDLFEAGARSVDLMQLAAEITRKHGVTLRPVDILDCPTPANLAALVMSRHNATHPQGADR